MEFFENALTATFTALPPLVFAGLGGMITAKVGLLNLGLEGMMLMSAFVAAIANASTGSWAIGLIAAMVFSSLVGLLFAVFNIKFKVNNIVVSVALNMLALALTKYILITILDVGGTFRSDSLVKMPFINIPGLENIPILRSFNGLSIIFWFAIITTIILMYVVKKTPAGLRMRATGLNDTAVNTAGVSSDKVRYICLVLSGTFCGIAGAYMSTSYLGMFTSGMTSGRGYLGNIASILGGRTPGGTFLGSLLFSATEGFTLPIQTMGFPSPIIQLIPYLVAILAAIIMAVIAIRKKKRVKTIK